MTTDLDLGIQQLALARPQYDKAHNYFEGSIEEFTGHFHQSIRKLIAEQGSAYRFRLARKPVTFMANRVKIAAVKVLETEGDSTDNTEPGAAPVESEDATDTLDLIRKANKMVGVYEYEQHLRTFEFGDSYLFVWNVDPDEENADPLLKSVGVEMVYHSPMNVRMIYDQQTERYARYVINRWQEKFTDDDTENPMPLTKVFQRIDLWYRDHLERYWRPGEGPTTAQASQIATADKTQALVGEPGGYGATLDTAGWQPYVDDQSGPDGVLDNPHGELPWFHFRTAMPYGRPLHENAYGPQDAINKLTITHLTSIDGAGWPQRVALMDPAAILDQNNDDPEWKDDAEAVDVALRTLRQGRGSGDSRQRSGPGTTQYLTGVKDVKQFDAAQSSNFIEPIPTYLKLMAICCDTPLQEIDPASDPPSGKALKTANAPADAAQGRYEALLDGPWGAAYRFALKLKGVVVDSVDIEFEPVLQTADVEEWDVVAAKNASGVPKQETLREQGYDPKKIEGWFPDADEQDMDARVDTVVKLAAAMRDMSSAVTSNLLDAETARKLLATLLTDATGTEVSDEIGQAQLDAEQAKLLGPLNNAGVPGASDGPKPGTPLAGAKPPIGAMPAGNQGGKLNG